jgi:hypothetical protein
MYPRQEVALNAGRRCGDTDAGIAWPATISRSRLRWKKDAPISKNLLVQIRIEQRGGPLVCRLDDRVRLYRP